MVASFIRRAHMNKKPYSENAAETEKLPQRYILDHLRKRMFRTAERQLEVPPAPAPEVKCGTEAPPTSPVEAQPAPLALSPLELPPGKEYYRVSEVSQIIGVKPHVLRFWQSEFTYVRPKKSGNGHWVYTRKDVQTLNTIRHLLYEEKYSIKGAKKRLKELRAGGQTAPVQSIPLRDTQESLKRLSKELKDLIQIARNTPI